MQNTDNKLHESDTVNGKKHATPLSELADKSKRRDSVWKTEDALQEKNTTEAYRKFTGHHDLQNVIFESSRFSSHWIVLSIKIPV